MRVCRSLEADRPLACRYWWDILASFLHILTEVRPVPRLLASPSPIV